MWTGLAASALKLAPPLEPALPASGLGQLAVALLVLLAGAARTRVVAADLLRGARERHLRFRGCRECDRASLAGHALAPFVPHRRRQVGVLVLHVLERARLFLGRALRLANLLLRADLHRHEVARHL